MRFGCSVIVIGSCTSKMDRPNQLITWPGFKEKARGTSWYFSAGWTREKFFKTGNDGSRVESLWLSVADNHVPKGL